MFSHHLRFSSNPRASPRRKQIVFDKPPCFVQSSWWVSLHSRCTIIRSKTIFFLYSLFLPLPLFPPRQKCTAAAHLFIPKGSSDIIRVFVFFLTLCFIRRIKRCLHVQYICVGTCTGSAFDYYAICLASNTIHYCTCLFQYMCVYTESVKKYK